VDLEIRLTWSTSLGQLLGSPVLAPLIAPPLPGGSCVTPHTDELRCMVVTADRSPARYVFELNLAEMPSGPLNSKPVMLRIQPVSRAIARAAVSVSSG